VIGAVVALVGALIAVLALATYVITLMRGNERDRAEALVRAEKLQGDVNLANAEADAEIARLADDVRRATRRADALETWARGRLADSIDDGTDLLFAELSIVASPADDTDTEGGDSGTVAAVHSGVPAGGTAPGGEGAARANDDVPAGEAP
jgi:hypothetical protein